MSALVLVAIIGVLASVLSLSPPPADAQTPADAPPSINEYPCPFETIGDRVVQCGEIEVPLDRSLPDGTMVTVPFAIYKSPSPNRHADPVVYVDGGPGGSTLGSIGRTAEQTFGDLAEGRDLVLFDQRGTGFSQPSIRCPETISAFTDEDLIDAMAECGTRLADEGIDVSKFATDDVVQDLDDLRRALGYGPWNVYGISYGTTVALATVRDLPESARTIVLDSTYPQGLNTDQLVSSAANGFEVLAAGCRGQRGCQVNHAGVADGFVDVVAQLNETPAMVPVYDDRNRRQEVPVTGTQFASLVFQLMYSAEILALLPRMIDETALGDFTMLSYAYEVLGRDEPIGDPEEIDAGAFVEERYLATECNERYAFLSRDDMAAANEPFPNLWPSFYSSIDDDRTFSICEVFGAGTAPATENDQIFSDVPALVLAGTYDPITPPSWGEFAASGLSASAFYELPASSHGVGPSSGCAAAIMVDFLNEPAGSGFGDDCVADEPDVKFQTSRAARRVKVRNTTFTVGPYRIRSKAPRNWKAFSDDARIRDNGALDAGTGLIVQSLNAANRNQAIRQIKRDAGRGSEFLNRGTRTTTAGEWELFGSSVGPTALDHALIEIDGNWFVVLLVSELDERKRLRRVVLNQALKRFKVRRVDDAPPTAQTFELADLADSRSDFAELWAEIQRVPGPVLENRFGSS